MPTGAYNSQRLANIGIGHAAIDAGAGYTYLNEKTGHEFSVVMGPHLQPDMTFRVNRNVWFAVFSYANEFPEGGVAVNLDGGSS
ncbi:transporter [Cupriavidus basilensis]